MQVKKSIRPSNKYQPPNFSFVFARWQHRTDGLAAVSNCTSWLGVWSQKSPWGQGSNLTQPTTVAAKWNLNLSNGSSRGHECDRQTDHATEKCALQEQFHPETCTSSHEIMTQSNHCEHSNTFKLTLGSMFNDHCIADLLQNVQRKSF